MPQSSQVGQRMAPQERPIHHQFYLTNSLAQVNHKKWKDLEAEIDQRKIKLQDTIQQQSRRDFRSLLELWYQEYSRFSTVAILSSNLFGWAEAGDPDHHLLNNILIDINILQDIVSLLPRQDLSSNSIVFALQQAIGGRASSGCSVIPPTLLEQSIEIWDSVVLASVIAYLEIPHKSKRSRSKMVLVPFCYNGYWNLAIADLTPHSCQCLIYEPGSGHSKHTRRFETLLASLFDVAFKEASKDFRWTCIRVRLDARQTMAKRYRSGVLIVEGARTAVAHGLESLLQFGKEPGPNHAAARIEYASALLASKRLVVYDLASLYDRCPQCLGNLNYTLAMQQVESCCLAASMNDSAETDGSETDEGSIFDSSEDFDREDDDGEESYVSIQGSGRVVSQQILRDATPSNQRGLFRERLREEDVIGSDHETDIDSEQNVQSISEEDLLYGSYLDPGLDTNEEDWSDEDTLGLNSAELVKKDDQISELHSLIPESESRSHSLPTHGPCFLPFTKEMSKEAFSLLGPLPGGQSRPCKSSSLLLLHFLDWCLFNSIFEF
jgi:hypothetical protein